MSSEQVAQVLRMAGSEVKLVVARPIEKLEVENVNTIGSIVPTRTLSDPEAFEQHLMNLKKVNFFKYFCILVNILLYINIYFQKF